MDIHWLVTLWAVLLVACRDMPTNYNDPTSFQPENPAQNEKN
jgi:hypothetical protein